jgi:DNA repair protein RadC
MEKYKRGGGVGLRGNQSKIDMNKNGEIDSEDFTLLRGSMNGAWRNEHKHVNSTSTKNGKVIQYETRYARKHNPSRKGYKGKGNFEDGGYMDLSKMKANVINESNSKDTALVPEIDIENVQKLNLDITDNQIKSEADAVRILKQLFDKNSINAYEEVKVLFLDNNNVVIGVYNHSKGGVTGTIVDVEMICALAVKCLAKGVIMCHNHPSGKLVFSDADKTTSLGLKKALNLFTIILLDSIVITNDGYISMSSQGIFERGGAVKYHRGGSLNQHGLEQGDTIIKSIGAFQKVKDKKGNIIYVDLSSGYRDTQPPLPFKVGGDVTFSEK